jgi:hypothetical protein
MQPVKKGRMALLSLLVASLMAACNGGGDAATPANSTITQTSVPAQDAAAQTVEQYLQAKVAGDDDALRPLLCAEKEADFQLEASSFDAVDAEIEGMACVREADDTVRCEGEIVAVYGGEDTVFPLGAYRVVEEDGAWKWCGETE